MGEDCNGWTIKTLKEFLESRLKAHEDQNALKFKSIDDQSVEKEKALQLQAAENKRRLDELNHEHARVAAAQETYVSKDTWDGYIKGDQLWKTTTDRVLQATTSRAEFQAYKDTTEKALTLKAGQSQGIGLSASFVQNLILICVAIGGAVIAFYALRQ